MAPRCSPQSLVRQLRPHDAGVRVRIRSEQQVADLVRSEKTYDLKRPCSGEPSDQEDAIEKHSGEDTGSAVIRHNGERRRLPGVSLSLARMRQDLENDVERSGRTTARRLRPRIEPISAAVDPDGTDSGVGQDADGLLAGSV